MNASKLHIGIIHSLIGKNDGVSIVIDQSIEAMVEKMKIPLGNIFLLGALAPSRVNKEEHDIFWHKNSANKYILEYFSKRPPEGFDEFIRSQVQEAKKIIQRFVRRNHIDLLIVHNSCHPTNFVYAVAAGRYFEELNRRHRVHPKYLLWWHDSHHERPRFAKPNKVIESYLKYIPGKYVDGAIFINSTQVEIARKYFREIGKDHLDNFFRRKTAVVPNTCEIPWNWRAKQRHVDDLPAPDPVEFNQDFFDDIGLTKLLKKHGYDLDDAVLLLQHTRVVRRKRIDVAIDFAFKLAEKLERRRGPKRCVVLIVSGHSGDENDAHRRFLNRHFNDTKKKYPALAGKVHFFFAEHRILPEREIIVDRKYYRFRDIPGIIARAGGLGTYFSEIEGFGNNLLEMISMGLPVVCNSYPVFKSDIDPLGFRLVTTENCAVTDRIVEESRELIEDPGKRRDVVFHNLDVLHTRLPHTLVARHLTRVIKNIFSYR